MAYENVRVISTSMDAFMEIDVVDLLMQLINESDYHHSSKFVKDQTQLENFLINAQKVVDIYNNYNSAIKIRSRYDDQLQQVREQNDQIRNKLMYKQTECQDLGYKLVYQQKQIDQLNLQMKTNNQNNALYVESLNCQIIDLQRKIDSYREENQKYFQQLNERKKELEQIQQKYSIQEQKLQDLQKLCNNQQRQIQNRQVNETEIQKTWKDKFKAQEDQFRFQKAQVKASYIKEQNPIIDDISKYQNELNSILDHLNKEKQRQERLKTQIEEYSMLNQSIEDNLKQAELDYIQTLSGKVDQSKLQQSIELIKRQSVDIQQLVEENKMEQKHRESTLNFLKDTENQRSIDEIVNKIIEINSEIDVKERAIDSMNKELNNVKQYKKDLENKLQATMEQYLMLKERYVENYADREMVKHIIAGNQLDEEIRILSNKLKLMRAQEEELREQLQRKQSK